MSKKGVSFLSIDCLSALSKVCLPSLSSDSFKTLSLLRNISTATESSQLSSSTEYDFDCCDENYQNRGGYYGENQYSKDFVPKPSGEGLNPNVGFRESHRTQVAKNPVEENRNFNGFYGQKRGDLGHVSNWNFQNASGNFSGYHGNNNGRFQQAPGEPRISSSSFSQLQYVSPDHVGQYRQNVNSRQNQPDSSVIENNSQELAEASPDTPNGATLEELDNFCKEGKVTEAVEVLQLLEKQHVPVDLNRFLQLMWACGEANALSEAKAVHNHIMRSLSPLEVSTQNKIMEMYSKCGSMGDAFDVFNGMRQRNLTSWATMITWLAKNGLGEDAIDLFSQFKQEGQKPDSDMFVAVFLSCSAVGDVTEGMLHFESMRKDYGIAPSMQHYVSIVDMLGSNGYLVEALEFVEKMPIEPNVDIWKTLMNLCRVHGHAELGDRCAEIIEQLEPSCLDEQSRAGLIPMNAIEPEKEKKAQNILEVRSKVHEYRAGDTSHPDSHKHYALLRGLKEQMKEAGYIPETRMVLHDIDQEGKEEALLSHSERLATAHALLTSPARTPIRVIKNLRVCVDCHNALKIISKIVGRELIMRDSKRFHHLKDGVCSCRDYW